MLLHFVFVGPEHELRWAQERMEESFLVKVIGQLGGDPGDLTELRVLNRLVRWTKDVILLEADTRHQEILVAAEPGNVVFTPGAHNPADILTKAVNREVLDRHLRTLGLTRADGRAETAPRAQLQA